MDPTRSLAAYATPPRGRQPGPQDHRKPTRTGLTNDHDSKSVYRVQRDLEDDDWLQEQRRRIGRSIKAARMDANRTQEQVFLAVPLSRAHYQDIEAGTA